MARPESYLNGYKPVRIKLPREILPGISAGGPPLTLDLTIRLYSNTGSMGTARQNVKGLSDGTCYTVQKLWQRYNAVTPKLYSAFPVERTVGDFEIQNAFQGKGSPEDIAAAAAIWASLEWDNELAKTLKKRTWASEAALRSALLGMASNAGGAAHKDGYFGLDCLGFVVNFVKETRTKKWSAEAVGNKDMAAFTGVAATFRSTLTDLKAEDVIVYTGVRHIAVIDTVLSNTGVTADVAIAESLGDYHTGPAMSRVTLRDDHKTAEFQWKVKDGSETKTITGHRPSFTLVRNGTEANVVIPKFDSAVW